ncbi:HD-GYP domain-containing protein [Thalassospira sp. HJ]|uniref:HD-GYP domain-containing protein n=1 Tax=Thalassospira sp. HJ TaxID=1616823 RepID=UPI000698FA19|nr:HD domain-containing phosphohydrolase [Thalassospira sp. HJ]
MFNENVYSKHVVDFYDTCRGSQMSQKLRTTLHVFTEDDLFGYLPTTVMGVEVQFLNTEAPIPAEVEVLLVDIDLKDPALIDKVRAFRNIAKPETQIFITVSKGDRQHQRQASALGARKTVLKPLSEIGLAIVIEELRTPHRFATSTTKSIIADSARAMREIFDQAAQKEPIDTALIGETGRQLAESVADLGVLDWLDTVRIYHNSTFQHVLLVTGIACAFAQGVGMNSQDIAKLTQAGLLHDIGKIWTPPAILDKTGKLSPEEFAIIQRHPKDGYQRLASQKDFHPDILDAVLHHHEYLDGSGYPDGLQAHEIRDLTRILTICDIAGALLEKRPYKSAFTIEETLGVLFEMASQGKVERALVVALARVFDCAITAAKRPKSDLYESKQN